MWSTASGVGFALQRWRSRTSPAGWGYGGGRRGLEGKWQTYTAVRSSSARLTSIWFNYEQLARWWMKESVIRTRWINGFPGKPCKHGGHTSPDLSEMSLTKLKPEFPKLKGCLKTNCLPQLGAFWLITKQARWIAMLRGRLCDRPVERILRRQTSDDAQKRPLY